MNPPIAPSIACAIAMTLKSLPFDPIIWAPTEALSGTDLRDRGRRKPADRGQGVPTQRFSVGDLAAIAQFEASQRQQRVVVLERRDRRDRREQDVVSTEDRRRGALHLRPSAVGRQPITVTRARGQDRRPPRSGPAPRARASFAGPRNAS